VSVACLRNVHVFEYNEDEDISLGHVANIPIASIDQMVFVEYFLIMAKKEGSNLVISCYNPEDDKPSEPLIIEDCPHEKVLI